MKLALGPLQYYWSREKVFSFYKDMAEFPLDIVYLGETVCARRHELREEDWFELADLLSSSGKEVVLSTQVLLESGAHLNAMHRIVENQCYTAEANDMGAVGMMDGRTPFVAGPHLNLYNPEALQIVAEEGAKRWVMPFEMSGVNLQKMLSRFPDNMESEVFVSGRLPLAYSARCFTARYHNLQKDSCQFRCLDYPDGLPVETREGEPFLNFNGIQTQSIRIYNLINEIPQMKSMGVDVVRLSPQSENMRGIVGCFREVIDGATPSNGKITAFMKGQPCNGYWYGNPGMNWQG